MAYMYMLSHVYCIQTGCSASASDYTLDTVEGTEEVLDSSVLACFSLSLSLLGISAGSEIMGIPGRYLEVSSSDRIVSPSCTCETID